jgi:hypothetical protein
MMIMDKTPAQNSKYSIQSTSSLSRPSSLGASNMSVPVVRGLQTLWLHRKYDSHSQLHLGVYTLEKSC